MSSPVDDASAEPAERIAVDGPASDEDTGISAALDGIEAALDEVAEALARMV